VNKQMKHTDWTAAVLAEKEGEIGRLRVANAQRTNC
jgi:hypothetical protein